MQRNHLSIVALCAIFFAGLLILRPAKAQEDIGTEVVDNEAILVTTGLQEWIDAGWTGRGHKIGVLDTGFGGLDTFEADNGLTVTRHSGDTNTYDESQNPHGRQVLEVIHLIAPGADLSACAYTNFPEYAACVSWFIAEDIDIINHSAGVAALPLDGTNAWAIEADRAIDAGILWVNAAGNYAGGLVEDDFRALDPDLDPYHEFSRDRTVLEAQPLREGSQRITVTLSWEDGDAFPANAIDFDLEIVTASETLYTTQRQEGDPGEQALEFIEFKADGPFSVRIRDNNGRGDDVEFALFVSFATVEDGEVESTIIAPADNNRVLTVGAMEGNAIAPYSSQGPVSGAGTKPDVVAPGTITVSDGPFVGTSAAAPLVAGAAALFMESQPNFSRQEVFEQMALVFAEDDPATLGPDPIFGNGFLYLPPPNMTPVPDAPPIADNAPPPTPNEPLSDAEPEAIIQQNNTTLWSGPGVVYPPAGSANAGDVLAITGQAGGNSWYSVEGENGGGWVPADQVAVNNPGGAAIPPAQNIPPRPTQIAVATPDPATATVDPNLLFTELEQAGYEDASLFALDGFGIHWNANPGRVRALPTINSSVAGSVNCGVIVPIVAQTDAISGYVWYRLAAGGWVRQDIVTYYATETEAIAEREENLPVCSLIPPTNTPRPGDTLPPPPTINGPQPTAKPGQPTFTPIPVPTYNVTIQNNATCDLSGTFGPVQFNVDGESSTTFEVEEGVYTLNASGGGCVVGPSQYNIQGSVIITLG